MSIARWLLIPGMGRWTPAKLRPAIWLEPSLMSGISDDDAVDSGIDQAGAAFTSADGPTYKVGIVNGRAVLRFNGTSEYLDYQSLAVLDTDTISWFVVVVNDSGFRYFISTHYSTGGANPYNHYVWGSQRYNIQSRTWANAHAARQVSDGPAPLSSAYAVTSIWRADDTVDVWSNDLQMPSAAGATVVPSGHQATRIGGKIDTADNWFNGDLILAVAVPREISEANRRRLLAYAHRKYNVNDHGRGFTLLTSRVFEFSTAATDDWIGRAMLLDDGSKWMMIYRVGDVHSSAGYTGELYIRFSDDEGATWTDANEDLDGNPVNGFPMGGHTVGDTTYEASGGQIAIAPNDTLVLLAREEVNASYVWTSVDGGSTWVDGGAIGGADSDGLRAGGQTVTIGSDMYASLWHTTGPKSVLYTSADNGATWTHVSDIELLSSECSLLHLGGNDLLTVIRMDGNATTYLRRSDDLGATWAAAVDITAQVGVVQRPRTYSIGGRIYLIGRQYAAAGSRTVVYWSDDDGVTWQGGFYPDALAYDDTGYCDILQRTSGVFYMMSYAGHNARAGLTEFTFS